MSATDETALVTIFDRNGHDRIKLQVDDGGPRIALYNKLGEKLSELCANEGVFGGKGSSSSGLAFYDAMGRTLIWLAANESGIARLQLFDKDGKIVSELPRH
jgi:hypothetical protein